MPKQAAPPSLELPHGLPTWVDEALDRPWQADPAIVERFRADGHVRIAGLLPKEVIATLRELILAAIRRHSAERRPLAERDAYGRAFLQVMNLWERDAAAARFTRSRRLASVAAALLGASAVRLWHDQALHKEVGGAATPMHTDWHYVPTESQLCGAWIPLHDVPLDRGALCYASGTHRDDRLRAFPVSPESDVALRKLIAARGCTLVEEPFAAGEVGFHDLRTVHWTAANTSGLARTAYNIFYLPDGARHAERPFGEHQERYWPCPGQTPGMAFAGPQHPLLGRLPA